MSEIVLKADQKGGRQVIRRRLGEVASPIARAIRAAENTVRGAANSTRRSLTPAERVRLREWALGGSGGTGGGSGRSANVYHHHARR